MLYLFFGRVKIDDQHDNHQHCYDRRGYRPHHLCLGCAGRPGRKAIGNAAAAFASCLKCAVGGEGALRPLRQPPQCCKYLAGDAGRAKFDSDIH